MIQCVFDFKCKYKKQNIGFSDAYKKARTKCVYIKTKCQPDLLKYLLLPILLNPF